MSAEIMTIKELAAYLDITEGTIYKKVSNNEIPYAKLGTLLRFPKWAIDAWVVFSLTQASIAHLGKRSRVPSLA